MRILFVVAFLFSALPAWAEFNVDTVRDSIETRDFDRLEALFAEGHKTALAERDYTDMRNVYATLFVAAHTERRENTEAWTIAYPRSPYAATALTWMHYYEAYQKRGNFDNARTSPEALDGYHDSLMKAYRQTTRALRADPEFLPARDAQILLRMTHVDRRPVSEAVAESMRIMPNWHSFDLGLSVTLRGWGGSAAELFRICQIGVAKIPDYDETLCFIDVVISNDLRGRLREMAVEYAEERKDNLSDSVLFDLYLSDWSGRPEAEDEALRLHRATLSPTMHFAEYKRGYERISYTFQNTDYEAEATASLGAIARGRLRDNPESIAVRKELIAAFEWRHQFATVIPPRLIQEIREHWEQMLINGAARRDIWSAGARVAAHETHFWDMDRLRPYYINAIYYSNYSIGDLRAYQNYLYQMYLVGIREQHVDTLSEAEKDALRDKALCPMLRAWRLYDAVCDIYPDEPYCNVGGWNAGWRQQMASIARTTEECASILTAEIPDLLYSPIPVAEFLSDAG
ncbi:hypothetical protein [Aliiroseovarius sp. YM-037]|uniref:hypothetical protein n=1 Tax=Aliiroseovarius sp. YM-037 TaxID=3341728 RepID=UPI003A80B44F